MSSSEVPFNRGAVRPIECLSNGYRLIAERYWLFLGISLVGILIGSLAPFGVLLGPCMCGIHYCLLRHDRGQHVSFDMLFKGFDYFVDSLVATLLMMVPMIALFVPVYVVFVIAMMTTLSRQPKNAPPDPAAIFAFLGSMGVLMLVVMVIAMAVHLVFFFIYPLIVDRGLSGLEAVKTSARAAMANFFGLLGLIILTSLINMAGAACCCYIGAVFVLPITLAATWEAYRQVFWPADVPSRSQPMFEQPF